MWRWWTNRTRCSRSRPIRSNQQRPAAGDAFDPTTMNLAALQPAGVERLFVLGGCADVSRKAAEKLLRPLAQLRLGRRVGAAAAKLAGSLRAPTDVRVAGQYVRRCRAAG